MEVIVMTKIKNTPCHFEFLVSDAGKAKEFYGNIFDWQFSEMPEENYTLVDFGDSSVCGGIMKKPEEAPHCTTTMYFNVDCVDTWCEKVNKAGGKVVVPKMAIKDIGWLAVCLDPDNNVFGVWETNPNCKQDDKCCCCD